MSRILVIDDDAWLTQSLGESLSAAGYVVDKALSAKEADSLLANSTYELIILDWEMPEVSGIDFLVAIRRRGIETAVLMLTGRDSIDDKTSGLDEGADDYLTKPFNTKEFLSRVRALLRRPHKVESSELVVNDFVLDQLSRRVFRNSVEIKLTKQEFLLLEFLMRHKDQVFNSEALVDRAWSSMSESSPDTVRAHMANLRRKLEIDGAECPIRTLHKQGYMFVSDS
jgi:DNA-binding response OmpR family regulator